MRKIKTIVHLDPDVKKRLDDISHRTGAPVGELIRRAVAFWFLKKLA